MAAVLSVTWFSRPGEHHPCAVCSDTGLSFLELLTSLSPLLEKDGIRVILNREMPRPSPDPENPGFFLNGHPLEDLLRESDRAWFLCHSSGCQPYRPSVVVFRDEQGIRCIRAPELLFRKAILRSLEEQ